MILTMSSAQSYLYFVKQLEEMKDNQKIFNHMMAVMVSEGLGENVLILNIVFHMALHLKEGFGLTKNLIATKHQFSRIAHESMRFRNQEMQNLIRLFLAVFAKLKKK